MKYNDQVCFVLMQQFGYFSVMVVFCIEKIVVNEGFGSSKEDFKVIDKVVKEFVLIIL